jgi:hypothetical protein
MVEEASEVNTSVIGRYTLGAPHLSDEQFLQEIEHGRTRSVSHHFLVLLRLGIQLLIVLVLLGVVWVAPVLS